MSMNCVKKNHRYSITFQSAGFYRKIQKSIFAIKKSNFINSAFSAAIHKIRLKFHDIKKIYGECFQLSIRTEQLTIREDAPWLHDRRLPGGGQLFSHGCHYIDLLLWMMGRALRGTHTGTKYCGAHPGHR